ncbi:Arc family DNA-binding protein [Rhodocytophaga aerolata]|uniref:Arc family DNA-binding protein n=1 Tax=Rhodocytophaga aerolata TaxID=455078 RepID=A0ABT8QZF2_9BACT|nr:Arc family DNA-binding protein [Rhodocytophaga aerolata]MDO1445054.1 Arc family DNA-binding protein [Rhodocytophaga aerolata]
MAQKKSFVLRINPETLRELEKWAEDEFRSVNGQIEYLLMRALKENGREPKSNREQEKSNPENEDT